MSHVRQFISSFIVSAEDEFLCYDWNISKLKRCVDQSAAYDWFLTAGEHIEWQVTEVSLLWRKIRRKIPVYNWEPFTNITQEFNETLKIFSTWWIVSDEFFQYINKLLQQYIIVEVYMESERVYAFKPISKEEMPFYWAVDLKISEETTFQVDVTTPLAELDADDLRYGNIMLLLKEVKNGFFTFRDHSIVNTMWELSQAQTYKIWQDLVINMKWTTVIDVKAETTKYSTRKNKGMWEVVWPDGTTTNVDSFVPIETIINKDWSTTVKVYWAYTHILRKVLGFAPQSWQYRYLINEKRLNIVAGTRRAGKTMLSSYKILRRLYRNPSTKKHMYRQIKMTYIAPSEDKFKSVLDFIDASSEKIKLLKVLKYRKDTKRLELIDETVWRNNKKITTTVATCDFVSDKSFEPGRGNGSDEVLVDEAGFIKQDTYLNLLPIIENENADFFCISTIDWETPKHWFYELLIDYEQENDPDGYAIRVTIDDIDEHIISFSSKERMKKALKTNMDRYYAELYATFPASNAVFDTSKFFIAPKSKEEWRLKEIIIWYDPAKRSDFWGLIVWEIRDVQIWDSTEEILTFIEEYRIQGEYNPYQKDFLMNLKSNMSDKWVKVSVVIDATIVGDVVAETFGPLIDYRIWYTGNSMKPEIDKFWVWKIPKRDLVHMAQILMETRKLRAHSSLKNLIEESRNFKMYHSSSGNVKYDALVGHDDVVNAMLLCSFYFGFLRGNLSTVQSDVAKEWRDFLDKSLQKWSNLYNQFTWRWHLSKKIPTTYHF